MMKKYAIILFLLLVSCNAYSQDIFGTAKNKDTTYLDPDDFTTGQYIGIDTVAGNKVFVGKNAGGGDYKYIRAIFRQDSTVSSGKIRLSTVNGVSPVQTIADEYYLAGSSRISAGIYLMQFRTSGFGGYIPSITGSLFKESLFERKIFQIFGHYVPAVDPEDPDVWEDELVGYLVLPTNNIFGDFNFSSGGIIAKTYDTNWVLKDNILKDGYTIEFKIFAP